MDRTNHIFMLVIMTFIYIVCVDVFQKELNEGNNYVMKVVLRLQQILLENFYNLLKQIIYSVILVIFNWSAISFS
jgi:hypothetical protein